MSTGTPLLTDKGREAIKNPQTSITARCRSVMVQIDGIKRLDDIRGTLRGLEGLEEAIQKLVDEGFISVTQDCRDIIKDISLKILGTKSPTMIRKIDELHAKYGDGCWDHLDELNKAARLFYGEVLAENLKSEFTRVLQNFRKQAS
jgi:hypothetical protein